MAEAAEKKKKKKKTTWTRIERFGWQFARRTAQSVGFGGRFDPVKLVWLAGRVMGDIGCVGSGASPRVGETTGGGRQRRVQNGAH